MDWSFCGGVYLWEVPVIAKEKPVGLVYIGFKKGKAILIKENKFKSKNRNSIQKSTVRTVIKIISKII